MITRTELLNRLAKLKGVENALIEYVTQTDHKKRKKNFILNYEKCPIVVSECLKERNSTEFLYQMPKWAVPQYRGNNLLVRHNRLNKVYLKVVPKVREFVGYNTIGLESITAMVINGIRLEIVPG